MYTDKGQGLVEYALILLLVALALIIVLTYFGTELGSVYSNVIDNLNVP